MPSWLEEDFASTSGACESFFKSFMSDLFPAFEAFVVCHVCVYV